MKLLLLRECSVKFLGIQEDVIHMHTFLYHRHRGNTNQPPSLHACICTHTHTHTHTHTYTHWNVYTNIHCNTLRTLWNRMHSSEKPDNNLDSGVITERPTYSPRNWTVSGGQFETWEFGDFVRLNSCMYTGIQEWFLETGQAHIVRFTWHGDIMQYAQTVGRGLARKCM